MNKEKVVELVRKWGEFFIDDRCLVREIDDATKKLNDVIEWINGTNGPEIITDGQIETRVDKTFIEDSLESG